MQLSARLSRAGLSLLDTSSCGACTNSKPHKDASLRLHALQVSLMAQAPGQHLQRSPLAAALLPLNAVRRCSITQVVAESYYVLAEQY